MVTAALLWAVAASPPNLLLVTIDTLRADRLRAYGYASIETPATDRLARSGVTLEDATVQVPQTRPSHASIFTGRLPFEHGIRDNFSPALGARHPTLAALLRARGYDTAAFIGSILLAASSGLDRGFAHYDDRLLPSELPAARDEERLGEAVVTRALTWLARKWTAPFFAWVHLYDPHHPYEPPEPYARRYAARPYDGEVAYSDAQVGRLLDFIDRRGLSGRTLIVVTSDHGEGLGEHGEEEHLMFLYDSTLRVPLILSWPGVLPAGARVPGQFRSVDLLPTILELLGAPATATSGVSRARALRKPERIPDNESYSESLYGSIHFGYAPLRALRAEGWKYIDAPRAELYHLREDGGETRNLLDLRAQVTSRMRDRLRGFDTGVAPVAKALPADAGTMERMAALGYLGGVISRGGAVTGADPKDKIEEFQSYTRDAQKAIRLYKQGDFEKAAALLGRLAQSQILSIEVQYFLGKSLIRQKRHAEAARALEEAVALLPRWSPSYVDLSRAYLEMGEPDKALAALDRGLRVDPKSAALHGARGILLHRRGDRTGARAALETARSLEPGDPRLRLALSAVYRDQGELARAIAEVREAARLDRRSADAWNALGVLLVATGKEAEAGEAFRSALAARPDDPDALFNLAERHLKAGRPAEAVPLLKRVLEKAPGFPGAAQALEAARSQAAAPAPGLVRLRLLRVKERSRAEEMARRAAGGEDFALLARSASLDPSAAQGGDLGLVRVEDLSEPLRSSARALSPGQVSPVLETPSGFVILKRER